MMNVNSIKTFPNASNPVLPSANKASRYAFPPRSPEVYPFFQDKVTNPSCERFASSPFVPMCYYTPCSKECMDQAANNKCPSQVIVNINRADNFKISRLKYFSWPENMVLCLKQTH